MTLRLNFNQLLILILALVVVAVSAQATQDCRVPADPDISGLGVRLGLYFQLASNIVLSVARPDEAKDSLLPTELFFTGFFIAVVCSVASGEYAPGAQISCTWYPVVLWAVMSLDWNGFKDNVGTRAMAASGLILASLCLNIWFWFKDLFEFNPDQCMAPRVFFLYNFSAYGHIRNLFRVFTITSTLMQVATFPGVNLPLRLRNLRNRKSKDLEHSLPPSSAIIAGEPSDSPETPSGEDIHLNNPESPTTRSSSARADAKSTRSLRQNVSSIFKLSNSVKSSAAPVMPHVPRIGPQNISKRKLPAHWHFAWQGLAWLIVYVVASELQLSWNHLDGINSVNKGGQIIPLAIGALSLLRAFYILACDLWGKWRRRSRLRDV
jgi:hypothetical protein